MLNSRRIRQLARTATIVAVSAGLMNTSVPAAIAQDSGVKKFNITSITDLHGHIEQVKDKDGTVSEAGLATIACVLPKAADGQVSAFVSTGDNIGGSAFTSALLDDEPTIEALNAMGLTASAVGNHEFDKGYADLTGRVDGLAEFPYLGANVTGGNPGLAPYALQNMGGVRVAFIGTVTDTTPEKVNPAGIAGVNFGDPVAVANQTADAIKAKGEADVIVAMVHEGYLDPNAFSNNISAVMAGDSHLTENQVVTRADGSKIALVQASHYGKALGDLDFTFDPASGKVTDIQTAIYTAPQMAEMCPEGNSTIAGIVSKAVADAKVIGDQTVATAAGNFYRGSDNLTAETSGSNRGVESTLSNALAEAAKQGVAANTSVKPDLGVMNAGGVRADLQSGDVTYAEAFAVQPFGNEITYTTLTGQDIIDALEQQWKDPSADRPVLALGWSDNFSYTYDPTKPQGQRVLAATIDGQPLDPAKSYVVAGSTFLLDGGDGFTALAGGTARPNTGLMDVQVFIDFLKNNPSLTPRTGQSAVGVHITGEPKAGEKLTIDLSSLIYTIDDSASEVTVKIGDAVVTAPITREATPKLGEAGKATVEITVPAGVTGSHELVITTNSGTKVSMTLDVAAGSKPSDPNPAPMPGLSSGSSLLSSN